MNLILKLIILFFLSFTVTMVAYPFVLRYAKRHNVVDNPDARKLHRRAVPVMGGVAVYAGILAGSLAMFVLISGASISWSIMAITVMLLLGVWDDIKNLPAILRLIIQFVIVGWYMWFTGFYIGNFYGFLGIHEISPWLGIPLSLVTGVGIINAINMIDGVDGYSSGYGIMASASFATLFIIVHQEVWSSQAVIIVSALIPFFFHNVFGKKSKMFIGDGGTMMIGFMMTIFVLGAFVPRHGEIQESHGAGVIAMTLAVMCVPVFDTLRVMTARMSRGHSPFRPDKTHLHHLFIDMGFSHIATTVFILTINFIVIMVWLVLWLCGASINVQTIVVILMGIMVTFGFYKFMRWQQHSGPVGDDGTPQGTAIWHAACRMGKRNHIDQKPIWRVMREFVDGDLMR